MEQPVNLRVAMEECGQVGEGAGMPFFIKRLVELVGFLNYARFLC